MCLLTKSERCQSDRSNTNSFPPPHACMTCCISAAWYIWSREKCPGCSLGLLPCSQPQHLLQGRRLAQGDHMWDCTLPHYKNKAIWNIQMQCTNKSILFCICNNPHSLLNYLQQAVFKDRWSIPKSASMTTTLIVKIHWISDRISAGKKSYSLEYARMTGTFLYDSFKNIKEGNGTQYLNSELTKNTQCVQEIKMLQTHFQRPPWPRWRPWIFTQLCRFIVSELTLT